MSAIELPPDDVLLEMFPFEPSGFYITNIADHGMADVPYDEEAELEMHLNEIAMAIDYIIEDTNCSLDDALKELKKDYQSKEFESCPGPHQKLTFTPSVTTRQSMLPTPGTPPPIGIQLLDESGPTSLNSGEAVATGPNDAQLPSSDVLKERERLLSIVGIAKAIECDSLTPEQKATFKEGWEEEEAKMHLQAMNIQSRKFLFQNRRVMLTYRTHIDKEKLKEFIRVQATAPDACIDVAHETGDKVNPYYHTHAIDRDWET